MTTVEHRPSPLGEARFLKTVRTCDSGAFALLNRRFKTSQADNGSWGYYYSAEGKSGGSSALTCVALLGLSGGGAVRSRRCGLEYRLLARLMFGRV